MLHAYIGSDTQKAREKLGSAIAASGKGREIVRITDAHTSQDLAAALGGGGMFAVERVVVFDSVLENVELREQLLSELARIAESEDVFYIIESAPDAATKKLIEKHAKRVEKYDLPKKAKGDFFALGNALQRGKKKDLWVLMQEDFAAGKAAEMVHGSLFWAAKQMCLREPSDKARRYVAELAELPHEARRRGMELEYALEHFALSRV